jgi:rhodanese-related sulfurtransferase
MRKEEKMKEERGTLVSCSRRRGSTFLLSLFSFLLLAPLACKTVGISMTSGGYAEVSPTVANEMILDSRQVVILDVRPDPVFRGPEGYIAGAINVPIGAIENQLPELLGYQDDTVLVYGANSDDGAVAAKILTVAGFRNVVHIAGGIEGWIEKGYRRVNALEP